jgi:hypothetical protein
VPCWLWRTGTPSIEGRFDSHFSTDSPGNAQWQSLPCSSRSSRARCHWPPSFNIMGARTRSVVGRSRTCIASENQEEKRHPTHLGLPSSIGATNQTRPRCEGWFCEFVFVTPVSPAQSLEEYEQFLIGFFQEPITTSMFRDLSRSRWAYLSSSCMFPRKDCFRVPRHDTRKHHA